MIEEIEKFLECNCGTLLFRVDHVKDVMKTVPKGEGIFGGTLGFDYSVYRCPRCFSCTKVSI